MKIDLPALAMGVVFAFMWSSAFATARIIVADAPPLTALALRFLISGVIAVTIARALGQSWHLTRAQWRGTAIFGVCQNGIYLGLNFTALQWVEASLAAVIASTMPLLVALGGWAWFGQRLRPLGIAGLVAGFAGVALILGARISGGSLPLGMVLCGIGTLGATVATLSVRGASSGGNLLMIVGLQMLLGSVLLGAAALAGESFVVTWSGPLLAAFAYQILVPGLAATLIWFLLVRRIGAVKAATFHFLNPFFGVATAAVLLGEPIRRVDLIGVGVVMAGILAVQLSRQTE